MSRFAPDTVSCTVCGTEHDTTALAEKTDNNALVETLCISCGHRHDVSIRLSDAEAIVGEDKPLPTLELTAEEVSRRLPTHLIDNDEIRTGVIQLTQSAPSYFWAVPAAKRDYHNDICQKERGLWAHTLMAATVLEQHLDSWAKQERITELEKDYARAAILLHDQRKNGSHENPESSSTSDHNLHMADVIRSESDLPEPVAIATEQHMGPYYDGPSSDSEIGLLVHVSDNTASTNAITPKAPEPVPDEIQDLGTDGISL